MDFSEEIRFLGGGMRYGRAESGLGIQYGLWRKQLKAIDAKLRVGIDYSFINQQSDKRIFENKNRVALTLNGSKEWKCWEASIRMKWQTTWNDETRGNHPYSPQMKLRTRAKVSYKPEGRKIRWFVEEESHYRIFDPRGNKTDELRTTLGAQWRLDKKQALSIYARCFNEVNVKKPETTYLVGLGYSFE